VDQDAAHEIGGGQGTGKLPTRYLRVDASAIIDANNVAHAPGAILLGLTNESEGGVPGWPGGPRRSSEMPPNQAPYTPRHAKARVIAVGTPAEVDRHPGMRIEGIVRVCRPSAVLIPGLVNAHAHLDLTHIGPRPYQPEKGFMGFVEIVRSNRLMDDEAIAASVQRGIELSLAGGVVAVGDIAGSVRGLPSLAPLRTLAASPLWGVSYLEFFAFGKGQEASLDRALATFETAKSLQTSRFRAGLSPHAPYSVSPPMLERAMRFARTQDPPVPVCTHVAETMEEREFIAEGSGPFRKLLESLGLWSDELLAHVGQGRASLDHFLRCAEAAGRTRAEVFRAALVLAHVNDALPTQDSDFAASSDALFARTKAAGALVAYCPRASEYFGAQSRFGPHTYADMEAELLDVALGTDSVLNLPPMPGCPERISTLDEARLLARRDGEYAPHLLGMCTTLGARALSLDECAFRFESGHPLAGLVAIPCIRTPTEQDSAIAWLQEALSCETSPELLLVGK
jgi:cytosine/adenosine deaminase-related metal-dependent hydrolase